MNEILHTWVDTTTYSRDDENRVPSCWTYNTGKLRISVLKGHRNHPDKWVLHCFNIGMDTVTLNAPIETPVADVQAAALRIVNKRLTAMIESLNPPTLAQNTTEQ